MRMSDEKTLKINKIEDGIVIDHISPGVALEVLSVLKITGKDKLIVSVLMNVPSQKDGTKDIVKVEIRRLAKKELDLISLVSPDATINIIEKFQIKEKFSVKVPKEISGIIKCSNQNCVTNTKEPVESRFKTEKESDTYNFRCHFCERTMGIKEIRDYLIK
jgi:aspartate carbamoyltransferase regulatory subunit